MTIARRDGSQIIVEADGDVWTRTARGRVLRRRLSAPELDTLRAALASGRPEDWRGKGSPERLAVEISGRQLVADLPSGDPAINGLLRMVEH